MIRTVAASLALAAALPAGAAELDVSGFYRARGRLYDTLSFDPQADDSEGLALYMQHRFILQSRVLLNDEITVRFDVKALDGVTWGDSPPPVLDPVTGNADPIALSEGLEAPSSASESRTSLLDLTIWRAYADLQLGDHRIKFGRVPLHWGSGIWRNDGLGLLADYGDTADRVEWEGLFGDVYTSVAFDVNASGLLAARDDTFAVSGTVAYRSETVTAGLVIEGRRNVDPGLNVFTFDGAVDAEIGKLELHAEAIARFGNGDLDTGLNDVRIASVGGVVEGRLYADFATVSASAGVASGDGDPNDATLSTFTFDRDYNVGVILFEQALPTLAASTPTSANGGRDTSSALLGAAVSNTLFVRPSIARAFGDVAEVEASILYARVLKAPEDADFTGRRTYGTEIDLTGRWIGTEHLDAGLTGALFLPGDWFTQFADRELDRPIFGAQLVGRARF